MNIREFLANPPVVVDNNKIRKHFNNKTVLVTGGAGYIGSALCHKLFDFGVSKVIAFDIDDTRLHNLWLEMDETKPFVSYLGDVKDNPRVTEVFNEYNIDIVFHTAAIKHVPLAELYPKEAVKVNVLGTNNVLKNAIIKNVDQFINISTDKAADAIGAMGKTKYAAELMCMAYGDAYRVNKKIMTMRFGNIYDSRGSVVPTFKNKIRNDKPIQITDTSMERYFIKADDAILLTLHACTINEGYKDIFTFDMGRPIKIIDIANHLIEESGKDININIIGKRPGEKLNEVLFSENEMILETDHPRIYKIFKKSSKE